MKIATLGAATLDVFLLGDKLHAKRDVRTHDYVEQFPLGDKVELDDVVVSTGGGATNAAVTFARQGFNTSVLAKVGDDLAGREVIQMLQNDKVKTDRLAIDLDGATGYSTILLSGTGERTVLVYRGTSEQLKPEDFKLGNLDASWLYISSLAGNFDLLEAAIKAAVKNQIKVALNPGSRELQDPERLRKLLDYLAVLMVNKDEMRQLYEGKDTLSLLKAASGCCSHVVITDGARGSWATDRKQVYRSGVYKEVKVVDRTGAGDAFGSGFIAKLATGKPIEQALSFASANATSVVRYVGAKQGIIHGNVKLRPMKIDTKPLS